MSLLADLRFVVTRRPPPRNPPPAVMTEAAQQLAASYGTDGAICILIAGWDEKQIEKLRHNLVSVGHKATPKFGVTTQRGTDETGRPVIWAWAREPRPPRKKRPKG